MGRMVCSCGHVMSDVASPCPTTGSIVGDVVEDAELGAWCRHVASFLSALRGGRRVEWIRG